MAFKSPLISSRLVRKVWCSMVPHSQNAEIRLCTYNLGKLDKYQMPSKSLPKFLNSRIIPFFVCKSCLIFRSVKLNYNLGERKLTISNSRLEIEIVTWTLWITNHQVSNAWLILDFFRFQCWPNFSTNNLKLLPTSFFGTNQPSVLFQLTTPECLNLE